MTPDLIVKTTGSMPGLVPDLLPDELVHCQTPGCTWAGPAEQLRGGVHCPACSGINFERIT